MPDNGDNKKAQYFCYARKSTDEQNVASLDMQEEMGRKRAAQAGGTFTDCFREVKSASKIRWDRRPQFIKLLHALQPGDHLVVWRLDRIDRSLWGAIDAVRELERLSVVLHIEQEVGGEKIPPLDSLWGKIFLIFMGLAAEMETDQKRKTSVAAAAWRKENGFAYSKVPIGKRRIVLELLPGQNKPLKRDVWDETECRYIREIVRRRDAGEAFWSIAQDFCRRELQTASNKPWARRQKKGYVYQHRVEKAYYIYKKLEKEVLARGGSLTGLPFESEGPEDQEIDMGAIMAGLPDINIPGTAAMAELAPKKSVPASNGHFAGGAGI